MAMIEQPITPEDEARYFQVMGRPPSSLDRRLLHGARLGAMNRSQCARKRRVIKEMQAWAFFWNCCVST